MELFTELSAWHWLSLGILFLVAETLGAAGFLLGLGVGALLTALIASVLPSMSWQAQLLCFAVLSIISTWVYWSRFRNINQATDQPLLNTVEARLLGKSATLLEDTQGGRGKIQVADALWAVQLEGEELSAGDQVKVVAVDGMVLKVVADQ